MRCGLHSAVAAAGAVLGPAGMEDAPTGSLPVFKFALRPTYWLVHKVFARFMTNTRGL